MFLRIFAFLITLALFVSVRAQFGLFEQMFGQQHQQQQQQQQRPPSGVPQWVLQSDAVPCSQYLCPNTLFCASGPAACPCPDVEDVRCVVPDAEDRSTGTVMCVRGQTDCAEVQRLAKPLK